LNQFPPAVFLREIQNHHAVFLKNIKFGPMSMKNIKLVATDLDGTFLMNDRTISGRNLEALHQLGAKGIIRVAATGRNLKKVSEVISPEVPFDYIIFSSGAGIFDWKHQKHIFDQNISMEAATMLTGYFREMDYNFSAFAPAPGNHRLWFHRGGQPCEEFNRFFTFHNSHSEVFPSDGNMNSGLCQFLLIIPENEQNFARLRTDIESRCSEVRVIRASSPVTKGYIWAEVFHRDVSKGHGVKHLCSLLSVHPDETMGIGNDYNDLDLLNFTAHSFMTGNAPGALKNLFIAVPSNEEDAFAHAVQPFIQ
jgi:Cof subfamily protein (haloacid dehalogenase superfamily)